MKIDLSGWIGDKAIDLSVIAPDEFWRNLFAGMALSGMLSDGFSVVDQESREMLTDRAVLVANALVRRLKKD